jgi:hypothetical protein
LALLAALASALLLAFRQGLIPPRLTPIPRLDLASPPGMLLDWQLAELGAELELCRSAIASPHIDATPVADKAIVDGCGWTNAVRLAAVGGARLVVGEMSCELAAATAAWMRHEVQPLAVEHLGERIGQVQHLGSYACRNIAGTRYLPGVRSEHATANAVDIAGFVTTGGKTISVKRHWSSPSAEGRFLRLAFARGCRYFRVAIGPDYNDAHKDHFHFDRGLVSHCR